MPKPQVVHDQAQSRDQIPLAKSERHEMHPLTADEIDRLSDAARYRALILTFPACDDALPTPAKNRERRLVLLTAVGPE